MSETETKSDAAKRGAGGLKAQIDSVLRSGIPMDAKVLMTAVLIAPKKELPRTDARIIYNLRGNVESALTTLRVMKLAYVDTDGVIRLGEKPA